MIHCVSDRKFLHTSKVKSLISKINSANLEIRRIKALLMDEVSKIKRNGGTWRRPGCSTVQRWRNWRQWCNQNWRREWTLSFKSSFHKNQQRQRTSPVQTMQCPPIWKSILSSMCKKISFPFYGLIFTLSCFEIGRVQETVLVELWDSCKVKI